MRLEADARFVTFANGMTVREPIVTIDEQDRRLVWSAVGGSLTHYNASAQVFTEPDGSSRVVWIADLLPDDAARNVEGTMDAAIAAMKAPSDRLAPSPPHPAARPAARPITPCLSLPAH